MRRLLGKLMLLLSGLAQRVSRARGGPPARPPGKPRPHRAKKPPYDLAKDDSTDNQKYLM